MARKFCTRVDDQIGKITICRDELAEWTCPRFDVPRRMNVVVPGTLAEIESVHRACDICAIAYAQQKTAEVLPPYAVNHRRCIVPTRTGQTKLMVRMPLTDVLQAILGNKQFSDADEIVNILIEKGSRMIRVRSRANGKQNDRHARGRPIPEKLSSGFDSRIIQNASGDIIEFALEDKHG